MLKFRQKVYLVYRNSTIALYKCSTAVRKPLELGGVEGRQKSPLCCFECWWSVALIQQFHISDEGNQSSAAFKAKLWRTFTSQYRSLVHAKSSVFTTVYKKFVVELDTRYRKTNYLVHPYYIGFIFEEIFQSEREEKNPDTGVIGQPQSNGLYYKIFSSSDRARCPSWGILLCNISENYKFCSLKCKSTIELCILNLDIKKISASVQIHLLLTMMF